MILEKLEVLSMENEEILIEILKWQKLQGIRTLRDIIPSILNDVKKINAYEMSDGKTLTNEIGKRIGVSKKTVAAWWQEWFSQGIVNKVPQKRGGHPLCKKIVSLKDIGINMRGR